MTERIRQIHQDFYESYGMPGGYRHHPSRQKSDPDDSVSRRFHATVLTQLWVADMYYVPTGMGFLHL